MYNYLYDEFGTDWLQYIDNESHVFYKVGQYGIVIKMSNHHSPGIIKPGFSVYWYN